MNDAIEIVRKFYGAVSKGDVPGVLDLLHPDVSWAEPEGFIYFSGVWRTPQEVLAKLLVPLARDWDGFSAIADDFIVEGDRVVTQGIYSGTSKATGKSLRASFVHVWRVADGKLKDFVMYTDTLLFHRAIEQ